MTFRTSLAAIIISLAGFFFAPAALAQQDQSEPPQDVVKLKDGRELKGTIVKEQSGYIWLDVGDGKEIFLSPDKIESFTRTSVEQPSGEKLQDQTFVGEPEPWERVPGVTRAAILTAEGMVGMQFAAKPLREAIPMLKAEGIDLVVIKVNSGGGLVWEVLPIADVLHDEFETEFEVVCWVDSAMTCAALAVLPIEERYFQSRGHFGGARGWGDFGGAAERNAAQAERFLGAISQKSGWPLFVLRAFFIPSPVSCDLDQVNDAVLFRNDKNGDHLICDEHGLFMLNATDAKVCGVSNGTADTLEELTALLEPNHGKIIWVGKEFEGVPFPLCMAERHLRAYRKEIDYQEEQLGVIFTKYLTELENSKNASIDRRDHSLRRAEQYLARIEQMVKINPNLGLMYGLTDDWFRKQDEIIRRLRTQ